MSRSVFREELTGMSLGMIFLSLFGFVWASLGTSTLPGSALVLVVSAVVAAALILSGLHLRRSARSLPEMPQGMMRPGTMKRFQRVCIVEGVAILAAVLVLPRTGHPEWIPPVVALIVGIHFFPLASLFRVRAYHATGALLCAVSAATFLMAALTGSPGMWFLIPGIGSALVLWGTALFLAVSGVRKLHSV